MTTSTVQAREVAMVTDAQARRQLEVTDEQEEFWRTARFRVERSRFYRRVRFSSALLPRPPRLLLVAIISFSDLDLISSTLRRLGGHLRASGDTITLPPARRAPNLRNEKRVKERSSWFSPNFCP